MARRRGWSRSRGSIIVSDVISPRGLAVAVPAILSEVRRRMGPQADPELVRIAVEDAMAGRDPKW